MSKHLRVAVLLLLGLPVIANAAGHLHVGGGYYHGGGGYYHGGYYRGGGYYHGYYGGYYGPGIYYSPYYYGYYGYYGPDYYGPSYYYAPPTTVYAEPETTVVQPPPTYWYYCPPAKAYYPYVNSCPSGWEAVPAQRPPQTNSQAPAPSQAPPPHASSAPGPSGAVTYSFGDVLFETNKADLQPATQNSLATMLAAIQKEPSKRITVEGHTDSSGDAAANHELSQQRAEAVRQYLIGHGIPADRVTAVGKGADAPIAGNDTPEGRKRNRRVDVIVG